MTEFRLTEAHLTLIRHLGVRDGDHDPVWPQPPEVDGKRPFGNSDVYADVARILGFSGDPDESDEIRGTVNAVMKGLPTALQIVLLFSGLPSPAQPGVYRQARQFDRRSWTLVRL